MTKTISIAIIGVVASVGFVSSFYQFWYKVRQPNPQSFEDCVRWRGKISGLTPRECRTPDGKVFVESVSQESSNAISAPTPTSPASVPAPAPATTQTTVTTNKTRVISTSACGNAKCHDLAVSCLGLAERKVRVREFDRQNSKGTVIFTTGGDGSTLYGQNPNSNTFKTLQNVYNAGFETFEITWSGERGWLSGIFGAGYKKAMCGTAEVYKWIVSNRAGNPEVVCAEGGSGGSFQIAYSLSVYGLENLFDMVILAAGPPVARLDVGIFGTDDPALEPAVWPDGLGGFALTDQIMGWTDNGDYAKKRTGPDWVVKKLNDESLLSSSEQRDLTFPKVKVNFVQSDDETHADEQGRLYYNAIKSPKKWYDISGTSHGVGETAEGSAKIRELIVNECKAR